MKRISSLTPEHKPMLKDSWIRTLRCMLSPLNNNPVKKQTNSQKMVWLLHSRKRNISSGSLNTFFFHTNKYQRLTRHRPFPINIQSWIEIKQNSYCHPIIFFTMCYSLDLLSPNVRYLGFLKITIELVLRNGQGNKRVWVIVKQSILSSTEAVIIPTTPKVRYQSLISRN